MRILLIAPAHVRVCRDAGGPGGQVALLAEGLAGRGHAVTVRSSEPAGGQVTVELVRLPVATRPEDYPRLRRLYAVKALSGADQFDVIHSYAGIDVERRAAELNLPIVSALPGRGDVPPLPGMISRIAQSWAHAESLGSRAPAVSVAGVIYPAIAVDDLPFEPHKDGYLVALGPIGPASGSDLAVRAARKAEAPLVLLGPAAPGAAGFIDQELGPRLDGGFTRMLQPGSVEERRALIARASAVLITRREQRGWEPLAAEALAMGTPVISLDRGPARELVTHGETGFIVQDADGLAPAIDRLDRINPRDCRRRAYHLWDLCQAAASAEDVYRANVQLLIRAGMLHPELEAPRI